MRLEQCDVPLDDVDAALTAGLGDVTRDAIGKGRARMRLSRREVTLHSSDFDVESFQLVPVLRRRRAARCELPDIAYR